MQLRSKQVENEIIIKKYKKTNFLRKGHKPCDGRQAYLYVTEKLLDD